MCKRVDTVKALFQQTAESTKTTLHHFSLISCSEVANRFSGGPISVIDGSVDDTDFMRLICKSAVDLQLPILSNCRKSARRGERILLPVQGSIFPCTIFRGHELLESSVSGNVVNAYLRYSTG